MAPAARMAEALGIFGVSSILMNAVAMTLSNGFFTLGTACVFGLGFAVERIGYVAVFRCTAIATMVGAALLMAWPWVVGVVGR